MPQVQKTRELGADALVKAFAQGLKPIILEQTPQRRVSLIMTKQSEEIAAFCITRFSEAARTFSAAHEKISCGALIGETFREMGISFERDEKCVFLWPCPKPLLRMFGTELTVSVIKNVDFYVGSDRDLYATIIEVYSPNVPAPQLLKGNSRMMVPVILDLGNTLLRSRLYRQKLERMKLRHYLRGHKKMRPLQQIKD